MGCQRIYGLETVNSEVMALLTNFMLQCVCFILIIFCMLAYLFFPLLYDYVTPRNFLIARLSQQETYIKFKFTSFRICYKHFLPKLYEFLVTRCNKIVFFFCNIYSIFVYQKIQILMNCEKTLFNKSYKILFFKFNTFH